jgi:hypothetical protein
MPAVDDAGMCRDADQHRQRVCGERIHLHRVCVVEREHGGQIGARDVTDHDHAMPGLAYGHGSVSTLQKFG